MAKLSAHGHEVGRHENLTSRYAYMSDGVILKDSGSGWKKWGKVKPEFTPEQAVERLREARAAGAAKHPAWAAYRKAIEGYGIKVRWKVHEAVKLLPGDPDGVWGDLTDEPGQHGAFTLEEIVDLCRLYQFSEQDRKEIQAARCAAAEQQRQQQAAPTEG